MAKAILMKGGGGGVSSDEVTARREYVVKGYTALTADSNDEPAEGLIEDRGEGAVAAFAIGREDWNHQIWATFRNGWYHRPPHPEGHESYIYIKYEALANLLGVDPAKMLQTLNVADRQGQIKVIDTGLDDFKANKQNSSYGIDVNRRTFYIDFPHGSAYYTRRDGHPHACIDADKLGNAGSDSLLEGMSATSEKGVKFWGIIKRWICTTGDVITALGGEGFVWDDTHAGRGRGIITKIPNNYFVQGANWVFLPSPNLYPQNIMKGVNINGVTGTRDFVDKVNNHMIATNVEISMMNRNQPIALGNAYAGSETVFFGVETVREDVWDGFVRRDKGNGCYLIGRIPVSKNDSNLLGTFIRNTPVQIELLRDNDGNISLIHHGPNQVLGAVRLNIYIYAHSSISFRF